ncbi:AraC family transcriptional regulator [Agrobacterium salinitolerans]|uniref:AraC family transcriptional regulator n=1 Tax=Agrobacterium salinitolerans TaxID=1183413 RepID=A0A9X3KW57_9HYPH|nr:MULTISPECIES: AraC family transcriptional regulator [Agrobacterium]MCZ7853825.1 AraC family transcriptional regulator [Agrobacterium salinitolerans]MCZ7894833.1 AraC family transcriptional regulator [Agrobacterium salinitolerans]MCZ7940756.1 AraC family transcriptional regulator [Agrobacterium salinitolerans]TRA82860.1 AraC family transcriptional regulator [Agrobacterium salinitolerans]
MTAIQATDFKSSYSGTTFEDMVETFSSRFGPFNASPEGLGRDFEWKSGLWSDGTATLIISEFQTEWQAHAVQETPEWLSILLAQTGAIDVTLGGHRVEGPPGKVLVVNNHEAERFHIRGAPHRSEALRLDWGVMVQAVAAIFERPLDGSLALMPVLDFSLHSGELIGNLARAISFGMRDNGPLFRSPIAMSNLTNALADLIVRTVPHRLSHLLDRKVHLIAPRHVHRAVDFMHENIDQPISMSMIAEAAGVSVRTLENGFRAFRETTPAAYLRSIRLKAAREDLLDPFNNQSVKGICLKWGFFHFGRFALAYRAAYGESPSETRKRLPTI